MTNSLIFLPPSSDITPDNLNPNLKEKGSVFSRGRDVDGKKLIILYSKKYQKGKESIEDCKRLFLYHLERLERYD